jgi:hypothetical protein
LYSIRPDCVHKEKANFALKVKGAVTIGFHLFVIGDEIQERVEILGAGTT